MLIEHQHAIVGEMKRRILMRDRNDRIVLAIVRTLGPLSICEIQAASRLPRRTAYRVVARLLVRGDLERTEEGYRIKHQEAA